MTKQQIVLRLAEMTAVFTFLYPGLTVLRVMNNLGDGGNRWLAEGFLCLIVGFMMPFLVLNKKKSRGRYVFTYFTLIIPAVYSNIVYPNDSTGKMSFKIFVLTVLFFIGLRGFLSKKEGIFGSREIYLGVSVLGIVLLLSYCNEKIVVLREMLFFCAFLFLFQSILLQSFKGVDFVLKHRGIVHQDVIISMKRKNIFSVTVLFLSILFLLKIKVLIDFIVKVVDFIRDILLWIIRWIIEHLPHGSSGKGEEYFGFEPFDPHPSPAPLTILVLYFCVYCFCLFALHFLLPLIVKKIVREIPGLAARLKGIFGPGISIKSEQNDDYIDHVVIIKKKSASNKDSDTNIRRMLKDLAATSDPVKKVLLAYCILIWTMSQRKDITINLSDTTDEILVKAPILNGLKGNLSYITLVFNRVRYGKKALSQDETNEYMDRFFELRNILGKRE